MGCCTSQSCPTHPYNTITRICLCQSCLQPLCQQCVLIHQRIHSKLGYPAQIQAYDSVRSEYKKKTKNTYKTGQQNFANKMAPTSMLIKNYTREYFQREPRNARAKRVLQNLEVWKEVTEDPEMNNRISQFFRNSLMTNREIVGKQYSHLY